MNVLIDKNKLDILANVISNKSGSPLKLTLGEMVTAVDSISGGGTTIDSLSVSSNGTYTAQSGHAYNPVTVSVTPTLQTKTVTYTPTASQQTATITADTGYDGLGEVGITVDAIPQPEFVQTVFDNEVALSSTGYASWTPSTTAKSIISSVTATTFTADLANYEYIIKWETSVNVVLNSGATTKAQLIWEGADQYQSICKRPNSLANIQSLNFNGNLCLTYFTVPFMKYYNTSGKATYTYTISYGIYPALTTATFSSSTANNPTVTVKTPSVSARCNNSYFATARAKEVDQANTKIKRVGKLYRIGISGAVREMYKDFYDRFNTI